MMKYILISFLCLTGVSSVFGQSKIKEAYFHELRGMEDSSGVTHLFYRMYKKTEGQCSENNGGQTLISWSNNIYHFDAEAKSDSIKFKDYYSPWCIDGMYNSEGINDYDFYENDPKKWVISSSFEYNHGVGDYLGNSLNFEIPIAIKQSRQNSYQEYFPLNFYLSPNQDTLFMDSDGTTIPFPGDGQKWPEFKDYDGFIRYADSLSFDFEMLGIHPAIDSLYFSRGPKGELFRSETYSGTFTKVGTIGLNEIVFGADDLHMYYVHNSGISRSDSLGVSGSWESSEIDFATSSQKFLTIDSKKPGALYVSDSTSILYSLNFGDSFTSLTSVLDEVTGLYKKPDSDILYVLTREELLEVNTETKETTSLKKLPVSNESEPSEIPNQITLEQNYPNPFNPTTVIRYQLNSNQLVRLEVFDVTGRKVAVLVDGKQKSAGQHRVSFDGSGLSSGVYFYRLEAGGQTLTQKMLLVK
ncbi:T9SS type A sorting domain-containing protein [Gracilimonas tropica]|uniref:T9SS type A sorting domain-containing protein n=1 Tax=Gracilimonas tropica TaxID=454600 RepID=UPI0009FC1B5C|nr:T9SS type A sorting domain-containing protein [Gracilimonas tropica]